MKRNTRKFVCIACGAVCALSVFAYTQNIHDQAEAQRAQVLAQYGGDQVEVVVAARDIAPGATIEPADVQMRLWVADLLPQGALSSLSEAIGSKTSTSILAGEVVLSRRFGDSEALLEVPDGMTAVSVPAKAVQAVGGAVGPGAQVDVYASGSIETKLIGSGLTVLATSASSHEGPGSIAWITLAVKPDRAQEMVAAALGAQLYFTLPGAHVTSVDKPVANASAEGARNEGSAASGNQAGNVRNQSNGKSQTGN